MRKDSVAEAIDLIGSGAPVLLVVGRYVPGLRFVVKATCALAPYPYRKFLLWSAIGGTLWSIVTCLTAYILGTALGDNRSRLWSFPAWSVPSRLPSSSS